MSKVFTDNLELVRRAKGGDLAARSEIVERNMGLVWSIVRRFTGRGTDSEDLFQIGCIGLIRAADRFDEGYDVQFSTYAVPMIVGEIKRFLRDDGMIKVSRRHKELAARAYSASSRLSSALGREPTLSELAAALEAGEEELIMALDASATPQSLSAPMGAGDDESFTLENTIGMSGEQEQVVEHLSLFEVMDRLGQKEREIIRLRYFENKTQTETARLLGVSQVQVSRMERRILREMRQMIE